jgi:polyphosphate kinase
MILTDSLFSAPSLDMPRASKPAAKATPSIDLTHPNYYFNRELSWIEFNNRVLHEAFDPRIPLLERLRFMAIFSSNLDEFFMVRVAALKQQIATETPKQTPDCQSPEAQLAAILARLHPMIEQQHGHFEQALRPQLAAKGVYLLNYIDLQPDQQHYLQQYFNEWIFPILTPIATDPSHPFPYISNLSLNLAVVVQDPETGRQRLARVKVPKLLPRFIPLPASLHPVRKGQTVAWAGVPVEQIIAHHLSSLFPGMQVTEYYLFRITRNADLDLEEEEAEDLMQAIEQELRRRRLGATAARIEIQSGAPDYIQSRLRQELHIAESDVYEVTGLLCLRDLTILSSLPLPQLKYPVSTPTIPASLRHIQPHYSNDPDLTNGADSEDIFAVIQRGDVLLHHPYHSFTATIQLFIHQAAQDPAVLAIKMTLYRTSADSPILNTLIAAAENGKQVSVLVELKARFDEENNIYWARKLEQAGVHVVYGLVGLKTHAKTILVVRQEGEEIRRYFHIGTGDYNPRTSKLYADVGLLSCREALGRDLSELFNYLTGYSRQRHYRQLLVAPVNLREQFNSLIHRESQHSQQGHHARIVAKVVALVDPQLIRTLYQASQAGVKIDLIVQGVCCLRPGIAGVSDNIRVISVVGRYLEHSRIFYFHNAGESEVYIGSPDWMTRNFDRQVEILTPIDEPALSKDLQEILGTLLADNRHTWELQPNGRYVQRRFRSKAAEINAQKIFAEMLTEAE